MEHYTDRQGTYIQRNIIQTDRERTFSGTLYRQTRKVHSVEHFPTLFENDEKLKDPTNVVSDFNNFFITINAKLNIQQIQKGDASQF
jgi:hypothetical protein